VVPDENISGMAEEKPQVKWSTGDKLAIALACLAAVMALILFWIDKTPLAAGITIGAMFLLMIYPILHFVSSWKARVPVFILVFVLIGIFGWKVWPSPTAQVVVASPPASTTAPTATPTSKQSQAKPSGHRPAAHPADKKPLPSPPTHHTLDVCDSAEVSAAGMKAWNERRSMYPSEDDRSSVCAVDKELAKRGWNCKMEVALDPVPSAQVGIYIAQEAEGNTFTNMHGCGAKAGIEVDGKNNQFNGTMDGSCGTRQLVSCTPKQVPQ
jgi:hypothetical protein